MSDATFDPLDADGYPTDEALRTIQAWPSNQPAALFDYVIALWHWPNYAVRRDDNRIELSTGGWSGNEMLIHALQLNRAVWLRCWVSSERGGHYVFEVK